MRRLHVSTQADKLNPILVRVAKQYGLKTMGSLDDFIARLPLPSTRVYYDAGCMAYTYARRAQLQKLLAEC